MHGNGSTVSSDAARPDELPPVVIACHAWFHEQIGGSFKIATDLAEYLAARGHRVCYVCGTSERAPKNPTVDRGVELWRYPIPRSRSPNPANLVAHVRRTYCIVRKLHKHARIQCLNGHTPLQFIGASLAVGRRSVRQVYSVHSPFHEELQSHWQDGSVSLVRRIAIRLAGALERSNCRRATVVQCLSHFTASLLRASTRSEVNAKIAIAPGWVDIERFRPVDVAETRKLLGAEWQTDQPVFFSVRRLEPRMGLDLLVEAGQILREKGQQFRIIIGGSGSAEESLRRQIAGLNLQDYVFLIGRIADGQLPLCFAAADCFVLPTRALECFGLIVLEAFASGTPVIGTPVGAIPELVSQQGDGWLAADATGPALAERMAGFLQRESPWERDTLRNIAEDFSAEKGMERMHRLLLPAAEELGAR